MPSASIMKAVPHLQIYLTRVCIVRTAESFTIIQQESPVGCVERVQRERPILTDSHPQRNVHSGVRLQPFGAFPVRKTGAEIQIRSQPCAPRQIDFETRVERVVLIVIQKEQAFLRRLKIREPSRHAAKSLQPQDGISDVNLAAMQQPRRG